MTLSQKEIRDRATEFAHEWIDVAREKTEAQTPDRVTRSGALFICLSWANTPVHR
jgi:hypothetical protein